MLKEEFLKKLEMQIGKEFLLRYINCFSEKETHGFTLNLKKLMNSSIDLQYIVDRFNSKIIYQNKYFAYLTYDKDDLETKGIFPGKDPLYHSGLYYIQEPSASKPLYDVDIKENDAILDLCASPGGKTCEAIYALSKDKGGYIVANEIDFSRSKILLSNIERMGFDNAIVLNNKPSELVDNFYEMFDKVIVDAPCSGEGMFRKSEEARKQWSESLVLSCANMQKDILDNAYKMLKSDGTLIYSTCTFSKEEDEDNVEYLLNKYKDLKLVKERKIFPYENEGEGQFYAIFKRNGEKSGILNKFPSISLLKGLKVLRCDVDKFEEHNGRKEPTHASTHIDSIIFDNIVELNDDEVKKYIHGEEIIREGLNQGWCKITYKNIGLGLGKIVGSRIKNHYPKGLRIN